MSVWIVIVAIVLIAVVSACAASVVAGRKAQAQARCLRQDMQTMVDVQSQAVGAQIGQLSQTVIAQLGQVMQQVQSGVSSTGALASGAQKAVSDQLQASTEMLGSIRQQLGEVQQAGH